MGNGKHGGEPKESETRKKLKTSPEADAEQAPPLTTVSSCSSGQVTQPPVMRLGVVTWNVAHFGEGGLSLRKALGEVFESNEAFLKEGNAALLAETLGGFLDHYLQWCAFFEEAESGDAQLRGHASKPRKKLDKAAERHVGGSTAPESREEDEDRDPEDTDEDEPEGLAEQLFGCWRAVHGSYPEPQELQALWQDYYHNALEAHRVALDAFQLHWAAYRKETDEDIWEGVHLDAAALTGALKELRLATKMVVKPLLQLREVVNLADKVQQKADPDLEDAREALDEARKASKWKLSTLLTRVVTLDQCLHRVLIAVHVADMFARNPWLDVVMLQEVNQGIGDLAAFLKAQGLVCVRGFRFKSTSGKGSQTEYYPIVYREKGGRLLGIDSLWAIYNDGGVVDRSYDPEEKPELTWSKSESIFRPIVGYDVWVATSDGNQRFVRLGNVHTSPAGSEFSRPGVFEQVDYPLGHLAQSSTPVVVGGDFYLTAEAVTRSWGSLSKLEKSKASQVKEDLSESLAKQLQVIDQKLEEARKIGGSVEDVQMQDSTSQEAQDPEIEELQGQRRRISDALESLGTDQVQLIRNDREVCLSVEQAIRKMGLLVHQSLTGTNWKTRGVYQWYDGQIADFFVCSGFKKDDWWEARAGLVHPSGGLRVFDSAMLLAKYWRYSSDHFPVGVVLSTLSNDQEIRVPFEGQSALLTWTPAPYTAPQRPPTDLLGIVNNGYQCYANAALQLAARLDLTTYLQPAGQLDAGYAALRQEVLGILDTRRQEGQNGTYVAYGRFHRFTTASTLGLRNELVARGAADSVHTQEDSGEALVQILQAFDKRVGQFDPGLAGHLYQAVVVDQDFAAKRPSSFHFVLRVETRYELGEAGGAPHGGIIQVDGEGRHYSYRCDNFLRIRLPEEEEAEEEEAEEELPVLADLLDATWNVAYDDESEQPVDSAEHHYPHARRAQETITLVGPPPAQRLVLLERFYFDQGLQQGGKKSRRIDIPVQLFGKALRAFVVHIGAHAHAGHYVAYIHHDDQWFCLDDTEVIPVADIGTFLPNAYVLYYE